MYAFANHTHHYIITVFSTFSGLLRTDMLYICLLQNVYIKLSSWEIFEINTCTKVSHTSGNV